MHNKEQRNMESLDKLDIMQLKIKILTKLEEIVIQ